MKLNEIFNHMIQKMKTFKLLHFIYTALKSINSLSYIALFLYFKAIRLTNQKRKYLVVANKETFLFF